MFHVLHEQRTNPRGRSCDQANRKRGLSIRKQNEGDFPRAAGPENWRGGAPNPSPSIAKGTGAAARLPFSVAQPPPTRTPRPAGAPTRNRPRRPPRALRRGPDAPGPWECYPPRARAAPTRLVRSLAPPRAATRHGANGRMGPHPRRPGARAAAQWPGVMWGQHRGAGGGLLCTGPHRLGGLPLRRGAGGRRPKL